MININEARAKIAVLFRDKNIDDNAMNEIYENFIAFMNETVGERLGVGLFDKPKLDSVAKGEKTGEIEDDDVNRNFFVTRKYITKANDLINVLKALKTWRYEHNKDKNIRIEVLMNTIKIPLYLREGKYLPPDTYYHLNIITDTEKAFVEELNKQV